MFLELGPWVKKDKSVSVDTLIQHVHGFVHYRHTPQTIATLENMWHSSPDSQIVMWVLSLTQMFLDNQQTDAATAILFCVYVLSPF